jgi:glycosyl transferase family 87
VALAWRDPSRAADLAMMYGWTRGWIVGGEQRYTVLHDAADYPPFALVVLSPLGVIPRHLIVPVWIAVGLALAAVLPYLAGRCAGSGRHLTILPLLFWCWTSTRTLLQFTSLSLTLALASALTADTRWVVSGVALGLALFKPHIAGPFALWALVSGRLRVVAVAIAVDLAGLGVYAARVGDNPIDTLRGYWPWLVEQYLGESGLMGRTSIRGLIAAAIADSRTLDAVWIGAAACLLAAALWLAWRDPRRRLDDGGIAVPALFCLWSLAAIYHNTNNLILILPAFVFLWVDGIERASPRRWLQIVCLQAVLMVDVPTRLAGIVRHGTLAAFLIDHFDRLLVLACFVDVAAAWLRVSRRDAGAPSGGDVTAAGAGAEPSRQ